MILPACFSIPYCCFSLVQIFFGILVLIYLFACWALANFTCIPVSLLSNILSILSWSEFHVGGMITRKVTALPTITAPVESTPTKMTGQCYYSDMSCGWMSESFCILSSKITFILNFKIVIRLCLLHKWILVEIHSLSNGIFITLTENMYEENGQESWNFGPWKH